jgi:hypothetical protein
MSTGLLTLASAGRNERRVGRHDGRAARVGDDPHPVAVRQRAAHQRAADVEQLFDRVGPQHAALLEESGDGDVRSRQGAGVAGGGPRPLGRAAGLDHQDRLLARHPLGDLGEAPRVAEGLQVHADDAGLGIVLPVLQEVVARDVGLVAHGDELGEADAQVLGHVQDRHPEGAGLADEADGPGPGRGRREGGVQADLGGGVDHPHAVGTDHADARGAHDVAQLALPLGALLADLGKARGDDDQPFYSFGHALLDHPEHEVPGDEDDGEVDRVRDRLDVGVALQRVDRPGLRVDRIDGAGELVDDQVVQQAEAERLPPAGRAHHGDGGRGEDRV